MNPTPTTIKYTSDMLHLDLITVRSNTVLDQTPFTGVTQNYWVARITPPNMDQRRDAYRRPRSFERRYIMPQDGCPRYQIQIRDFVYGQAYEFGGDRTNLDKRIPIRVYAVYLGTNGTGTVADFRIYPSAEMAMEAERYMAGHPGMTMAYNPSMKLDRPAPAPAPTSTLMALPESLASRMSVLYEEMASVVNMIAVLEKHSREAGYAPLDTTAASHSALLQDAVKRGKDLGEKVWTEKFLPVVKSEAVRLAEEAVARVNARRGAEYEAAREAQIAEARKAQDAPIAAAAPVAQPVPASPVAPPASLLDAIVEEQSPAPAPAPAPLNRMTDEQAQLAARAYTHKSPMRPAPAKTTRKVTTVTPNSFPRPSSIPAPAGDDLPF